MPMRKVAKKSAKLLHSLMGLPRRSIAAGTAAWERWTVRANPTAVFVLGNQKSGTTAIAALLAKAAGRSVTLDIFYRMKAQVEIDLHSGRLALSQVVREHPRYFASDIIKEPGLTFVCEALLECFPQARIVFVLRDPRDNIRSILNRLTLPGNLRQMDAADWQRVSNPLWRIILDGRLFGGPGANYVETLALRWNRAVEIYEPFRQRIVLARYEDFTVGKVAFIASLAGRLGLRAEHDISAEVDIPYQPPGDRLVSWDEFFGPENLQRIEQTCAAGMNRYGYNPTAR